MAAVMGIKVNKRFNLPNLMQAIEVIDIMGDIPQSLSNLKVGESSLYWERATTPRTESWRRA